MKTTYEVKAEQGNGRMTLDELRVFVRSLDGASGELPVRALATMGGYLKSVKVEVDAHP